jgi:hypothetical protein
MSNIRLWLDPYAHYTNFMHIWIEALDECVSHGL